MKNPLSKILSEPPAKAVPATCKHPWELVAKTFAPAAKTIPEGVSDPQVLEKAIFGVTSYMWQCPSCGETKKEELLGSDENQLVEIFDKIEKFGMQYIKDGEKIYAITRWVPPSGGSTPETLPLR